MLLAFAVLALAVQAACAHASPLFFPGTAGDGGNHTVKGLMVSARDQTSLVVDDGIIQPHWKDEAFNVYNEYKSFAVFYLWFNNSFDPMHNSLNFYPFCVANSHGMDPAQDMSKCSPVTVKGDPANADFLSVELKGNARHKPFATAVSKRLGRPAELFVLFNCFKETSFPVEVELRMPGVVGGLKWRFTKECPSKTKLDVRSGLDVGLSSRASDVIFGGVIDKYWDSSKPGTVAEAGPGVAQTSFFFSLSESKWGYQNISLASFEYDRSALQARYHSDWRSGNAFLSSKHPTTFNITYTCLQPGSTLMTATFNIAPFNPISLSWYKMCHGAGARSRYALPGWLVFFLVVFVFSGFGCIAACVFNYQHGERGIDVVPFHQPLEEFADNVATQVKATIGDGRGRYAPQATTEDPNSSEGAAAAAAQSGRYGSGGGGSVASL